MKKKLFYGCGIAVLVLGILYGAGTFYYRDKFLHGTTINGILCENLTVKNTEDKIIDIAFKYGYETPESFTKAFTRFHGATPSEIRKNRYLIRHLFFCFIIFQTEQEYRQARLLHP